MPPDDVPLSRLRVALLNHVGSAIGGGERTIATSFAHRPDDFDAFAILFEDGVYADMLRSYGIEVAIVKAPASLLATKREQLDPRVALQIPSVALSVARLLRRWRIDVLYTNSMKAHVVGAFAGRFAGTPTVMHFHDILDGPSLWLLRTAALLGSRRRIACSAAVRTRVGIGATAVVYSPVETALFEHLPARTAARAALGLPPGGAVVSLVGRINRWKGHDRFVRIAARVAKERDVRFLIVGAPIFRDEDFLEELRLMVARDHLEDVVRFVPWVEDVATVFAAADVNANCSTREPLGRTPAEAAAAGVPSVVFDDSGAAEWMRGSGEGRVVPAHDEARFASAILDLLDSGAATHERSALIRETARPFDSLRVAGQIAAEIRAAADKKRVSS